LVIAIDGPAGSGKSTIAKLLAERFNLLPGGNMSFNKFSQEETAAYINSGNLYRAITLGCIRHRIDPSDPERSLAYAQQAAIEYRGNGVFLEGENVTFLLHSDEIDRFSAILSTIAPIRHIVNSLIRRITQGINAVVEGRDMTTVVFPEAEYRFYLDASSSVRAKRRYDQGLSSLNIDEIQKAIEERDAVDKNKEEGSLKIAPGVCYLDTSDLTIEQVYEKLVGKIQIKGSAMGQMEVESDTNPLDEAKESSENIQTQLQEQYLKSLEQLEEGQMITGQVIQITPDQVFIDVGYKSEGKIPIAEFVEVPKIGDAVSVILVTKENKYGEVIVSKQKADAKIFWKNLRQAFQDHTGVEGTVEKIIKGGFDINLGSGVHAFLPISQADAQKVDNPEKLLGVKTQFYVERLYSDGKVNIVVNRRKLLEEEIEKKRAEFFEKTSIGSEITGTVKSFTSFGVFIDLGGFDGLLHINDMNWGHVTRPKDYVKKGQVIRLKLIRIDPVEKRINLSLKHFFDDPWIHFEEKYSLNDIVKGRVTKLTDFGAFIEIEEGIEGLAHISEFSWVKKIQKPGEVLSLGDEVECMILGYDISAGRVSLGLKQISVNPWDNVEEKYPAGTRLKKKVTKITNTGAFIEIEDGIDGFLLGEDISWTKKIKHPGSELSVGQEVEVIVLGVDRNDRNIRLGIKQIEEDPWKNFVATYKPGSLVEGEVSSITDFGLFMRVPGGIEGLVHKSNLPETKDENQDETLKKYHVGDKVKAVILEIQSDKQKAAFSIKDYQKKAQRDEISQYMAVEESDGSTFTLGDFLKSKGDPEGDTSG
jgi:small subunit ribosomal protein S1